MTSAGTMARKTKMPSHQWHPISVKLLYACLVCQRFCDDMPFSFLMYVTSGRFPQQSMWYSRCEVRWGCFIDLYRWWHKDQVSTASIANVTVLNVVTFDEVCWMTTGHGISCKSAFKSTFLIEGNHCVVECDRGEEGKGILVRYSHVYTLSF